MSVTTRQSQQTQPSNNKEKKFGALWGLDYSKFFSSAALALAIYALFEVFSNPNLSLRRDEPLSLLAPVPMDVNQHLQSALVCYVLAILFASGGLFMDFLARSRLEHESDAVKEIVLSDDSPFDKWMLRLTIPSLVFAIMGLGFRLGAIHVWYSRGFGAASIILTVVIWQAVKTFKREIDKASGALEGQEKVPLQQSSPSDIAIALVTVVAITVLGLVGSIGRKR